MDWANESYVRLYIRDTKTWMLLGWEGQCLLPLILRKLDRSGVLADVFNAEDLAVMFANGMPVESIEKGLSRLIAKEVVTFCDIGLLMTNYLVAQETPKTDKQRQKESRERRSVASRIVTGRSHIVTIESQNSSELSHSVTECHAESQVVTLNLPSPSCAEQDSACLPPTPAKQGKRRGREKAPESICPDELEANSATLAAAEELHTDWKKHFVQMRDWSLAGGKKKADWQATLRNWMRNNPGMHQISNGSNGSQPAQRTILNAAGCNL
jgi:hypothetical protein